jgi:hypothetical protein
MKRRIRRGASCMVTTTILGGCGSRSILRSVSSAPARHLEVEQHHVRLCFRNDGDRAFSGVRLTHNLDVVRDGQHLG